MKNKNLSLFLGSIFIMGSLNTAIDPTTIDRWNNRPSYVSEYEKRTGIASEVKNDISSHKLYITIKGIKEDSFIASFDENESLIKIRTSNDDFSISFIQMSKNHDTIKVKLERKEGWSSYSTESSTVFTGIIIDKESICANPDNIISFDSTSNQLNIVLPTIQKEINTKLVIVKLPVTVK